MPTVEHNGVKLTIRTNNVPRDVIYDHELTTDQRAQFDYLDWDAIEDGRDSASFFRYRGELYDLGEFERWDNPASPTRGNWDGFRPDSYFSGLAVRYCEDFERVIVGLVMS
jgi:hypothetical protein